MIELSSNGMREGSKRHIENWKRRKEAHTKNQKMNVVHPRTTLNMTIVALFIVIVLNSVLLVFGLHVSIVYPMFLAISVSIIVVCVSYARWYGKEVIGKPKNQ